MCFALDMSPYGNEIYIILSFVGKGLAPSEKHIDFAVRNISGKRRFLIDKE